jgi:hypothetical protein
VFVLAVRLNLFYMKEDVLRTQSEPKAKWMFQQCATMCFEAANFNSISNIDVMCQYEVSNST